jgi:hypothetical protein
MRKALLLALATIIIGIICQTFSYAKQMEGETRASGSIADNPPDIYNRTLKPIKTIKAGMLILQDIAINKKINRAIKEHEDFINDVLKDNPGKGYLVDLPIYTHSEGHKVFIDLNLIGFGNNPAEVYESYINTGGISYAPPNSLLKDKDGSSMIWCASNKGKIEYRKAISREAIIADAHALIEKKATEEAAKKAAAKKAAEEAAKKAAEEAATQDFFKTFIIRIAENLKNMQTSGSSSQPQTSGHPSTERFGIPGEGGPLGHSNEFKGNRSPGIGPVIVEPHIITITPPILH